MNWVLEQKHVVSTLSIYFFTLQLELLIMDVADWRFSYVYYYKILLYMQNPHINSFILPFYDLLYQVLSL